MIAGLRGVLPRLIAGPRGGLPRLITALVVLWSLLAAPAFATASGPARARAPDRGSPEALGPPVIPDLFGEPGDLDELGLPGVGHEEDRPEGPGPSDLSGEDRSGETGPSGRPGEGRSGVTGTAGRPDRAEETGGRDEEGDAGTVEQVRRIDASKITRRLDRYLATRPGPVTALVKDLTTGRVYGYQPRRTMITASTAKVQILMALLLRTPWQKLSASVRRDARIMIRYSDNHAADRLWPRIGAASGFTAAGRKLGLRHTEGVPGTCVDLYCWGITRTSAEDQVRLVQALVSERSPLRAADRGRVLRLMGEVVDGQNWGISAARCRGDQVALKNGWLKRVSTERWAVVSAGLIRGGGHDYAIAVLTEGGPEVGYGIATVEGVAERIMKSFRRCPA
ncbi:serine hydrolase [Nonomuraea sp. MCN248]|uniref:Serine hydrolase n=1 Tax=Nonomuraea corallina TaxID=2989783 RepID=A0ABT4SJX5_9ACTN|nr:serine hydrolase [Nonomuraea corallina]MDA0637323.1 serine hydrolase [Nonomuraea corallina]